MNQLRRFLLFLIITPASYGTFYIFIIIFITTQLVLIRKPRIMRDFLTIKPLVIYLVGLL